MLQSLQQFKSDLNHALMHRLKMEIAMNKVTDFAPIELSCRWKKQYESREQRLSFDEFMTKKKDMLHRFMTYKAGL